MDAQFWINAWNDGRTNFHQSDFNAGLLKYFPSLNPQKNQTVLLPLCGKSKDMLWLQGQGLKVHGVELYQRPVEEFFSENKLTPPTKTHDEDFFHYSSENITLSSGDFFKLPITTQYDFVYDRAALVALPETMRRDYAQKIIKLTRLGGKCLLITYEYDQEKLEGPPFSVVADEVKELFLSGFNIQLLESSDEKREGPRFSQLDKLVQKVYALEKIRE